MLNYVTIYRKLLKFSDKSADIDIKTNNIRRDYGNRKF